VTQLRSLLAEFAGLFVEDGRFALAIAICLSVFSALALAGILPPPLRGELLFAVLAVTLVAAVRRAAR